MGLLDGKIAAVTGATSGSGRAIARRFVDEGATVVMLARGEARLEEMSALLGYRAVAQATDIGDPDSVRAAFGVIAERFGKLDVLVNNAAVYRPCPVEHLSDDDIMTQVRTNFLGPVYTSRAASLCSRRPGAATSSTRPANRPSIPSRCCRFTFPPRRPWKRSDTCSAWRSSRMAYGYQR